MSPESPTTAERLYSLRSALWDAGIEKLSSAIDAGAEKVGSGVAVGIGGSGALVGLGALCALRRRTPKVSVQAMMMVKPKVDTVRQASVMLNALAPVCDTLSTKLQCENVTHKAIAFHITPSKANATEAFRNELNCTRLDEDLKAHLSQQDFDLSANVEKTDQDFVVKDGRGHYFYYVLRSVLVHDPHSHEPQTSIALMLCASSFSTLQHLEGVDEQVVEEDVHEKVYESVLKSGGMLSSLFRPNTYEIVARDVYKGQTKKVVRTPVFKKTSFTLQEVEALQSHMKFKAAEAAQMMFNPSKVKELTCERAAQQVSGF